MSVSRKDNFAYEKLSRREIRSLVFHLIYAMESLDYTVSIQSVVDNYNKGLNFDIPLDCEAVISSQAIIDEKEALDKSIEPLLDNWRIERIGVCTKLVLRLSVWEITHKDTPVSIVINEAIELAKCFSEKDAYRFVNGILDEFCKAIGRDQDISEEQEKSADDTDEQSDSDEKSDEKKEKKKETKKKTAKKTVKK